MEKPVLVIMAAGREERSCAHANIHNDNEPLRQP